jgi:predicted metal-binding membrane protein
LQVTELKARDFSSYWVFITLLILILASWYYMVFDMTMNMEPVVQWDSADIAMLFLMWAVMMAGMMLPSVVPVILLVDRVNQQRKQRNSPYTQTLYFVLGYLMVWTFYSLMITFVQWGLHHLALLSPMMVSANKFFSGALLIIAGLYQWSPLKQRCLQLCRSPLSIITTQWKEGIMGAIAMGVKHGQYCLGCCWFLMAILFVTGVMNLKWILVLTVLVMVEKLVPKGELVSKLIGAILILLGLAFIW